jgi:hypothetical protein
LSRFWDGERKGRLEYLWNKVTPRRFLWLWNNSAFWLRWQLHKSTSDKKHVHIYNYNFLGLIINYNYVRHNDWKNLYEGYMGCFCTIFVTSFNLELFQNKSKIKRFSCMVLFLFPMCWLHGEDLDSTPWKWLSHKMEKF